MTAWKVPLADLDFGREEIEAVTGVLESRWLTMGEVTRRFEQAFAEYLRVKHAFAVANGTVALHMALAALDLQPGDEVIVPSLTFVATANAVLYAGGTPVFADILDEDDLTIGPRHIEAAITPATRAIVVMHYGGFVCDMAAILALARQHGLALIEDAAHAPGADLDGQLAGTFGDAGCFSFFSNKNLATGEGGMIVTDRDDLAAKIGLLRSHGMTSLTWDRFQGHAYTYDVVDLGYNYRTDELHSALGLAQLSKLERNNTRRRRVRDQYGRALEGIVGIGLPFRQHRGRPAAHIFPILLAENLDRRRFMDTMRDQGVQTSIHYPPVHQFSYYRARCSPDKPQRLPMTEQVARREVTLPLYPQMTPADVAVVVGAVQAALAQARR